MSTTDPSPPPSDQAFGPGRFGLFLGVVLAAAFANVLLGGSSFYYRDFGIFGYPLAFYHKECFWHGEFPLWNPFNSLGLPFLAQWNTLALYPGSLLYLLLPLPWSLNFFCLAHLWFAGMGMYALARRWTSQPFSACVAGLAFSLSGLLLSSLKWPNNIAVLAWMPWVVLYSEQGWRQGGRELVLAVVAGACQMLAGTPELILLTWLVIGAIWLGQCLRPPIPRGRMVGCLGLMILLISGICAAQLLPFFDMLTHSQRSTQYRDAEWAMPGWGWASFVVPLFHSFRSYQGVFAQYQQYWISSYYVSLGVFALAGTAVLVMRRRRVTLLAGMGLLAGLLALGEGGPLYGHLLRWFPVLAFMRFPIKFVVPLVFAIPLLAAFGLAALERTESKPAHPAARRLALVTGLLSLAIAVILWAARRWPLPMDDWSATWHNGAARLFFLLTWVGLLTARLRTREPRSRQLYGWVLLAVMVADALTHAPWQNPVVPIWTTEPGLAELQPRPKLGLDRAMLTPAAEEQLDHWSPPDTTQDYAASRLGLFCNCNLLDHIPKVDGFYSLYPRESSLIQGLLYRSSMAVYPALMDFLGVSQLTAPGKSVVWQRRAGALPNITAGQTPRFAGESETLAILASPQFTPRDTVWLPLEAKSSISVATNSQARIRGVAWTPQEISFSVEAQQPTLVVLAQTYHRGWQASVDNRPVPLWRANVAFQALETPSGVHQVKLVYRDPNFRLGLIVSALSLGATAALGWRSRRPIAG